jgi:hypothetical protein
LWAHWRHVRGQHDPGHKAVHDAIRTGEIGELHQVVVISRDPGLAPEAYLKVSGGILTQLAAERMAATSVQNVLDFFAGRLDPDLIVNRNF